jgi:hypothetical protein
MKLVELRNKERVAPRTSALTRLIWGRYTILAIVFGHKAIVDVKEED